MYPPFFIRKTLSKKLYMQRSTPLHRKTANCWALVSAMRGTFSAREMVAKERTPSNGEAVSRHPECKNGTGTYK